MRVGALVMGVVLVVVGLFGVGTYVAIVIETVGTQPDDRSLLFFGLGLAGLGAMALVGGVALLILGRKLGKERPGSPK